MDENDETPVAPGEGKHAPKAKRSRRKAATTPGANDPASPPGSPPTETSKQDAGLSTGQPKQWVSKLPEPFGRHNIDIGDGRRLRLLRSNRWQQAKIVFTAPEGEDPKPDAKYTRWLRDHGWQWRGDEKAWTKQLAKNIEENRFARANSDRANEEEFVELANLIRQDKGLPPAHQADEQRGVGT